MSERSAAIGRLERTGLGLAVVFLLVLAVGFATNRPQFFRSYLLGYLFSVLLALGSLGLAMLTHIWKSLPFWTLILIAGRLAIPREQYEAAAVDGASAWQKFRYVTWPSARYARTMIRWRVPSPLSRVPVRMAPSG